MSMPMMTDPWLQLCKPLTSWPMMSRHERRGPTADQSARLEAA